MIKSAVFPFHFWQPDFHTAAPTPVSAMLSSVVVKLGVYGFMRMTTLLFVRRPPMIGSLLVGLGIVGVVFGGLGAIGTHNAKRMLAYSTLAQIGFILVAIGWGTPLSLAAAVIFTFNHSLVKAAMLMLAGVVASRAPVKTASFAVVQGLGKYMPGAGAAVLGGRHGAGRHPAHERLHQQADAVPERHPGRAVVVAAAAGPGQHLHADLHHARVHAHLVAAGGGL